MKVEKVVGGEKANPLSFWYGNGLAAECINSQGPHR